MVFSVAKDIKSLSCASTNSQAFWWLICVDRPWLIVSLVAWLYFAAFAVDASTAVQCKWCKSLIVVMVLTAFSKKCFLFSQFRNFKIIYRRYAGLYFCICVDVTDNNLAYLEGIHNFVEVNHFSLDYLVVIVRIQTKQITKYVSCKRLIFK